MIVQSAHPSEVSLKLVEDSLMVSLGPFCAGTHSFLASVLCVKRLALDQTEVQLYAVDFPMHHSRACAADASPSTLHPLVDAGPSRDACSYTICMRIAKVVVGNGAAVMGRVKRVCVVVIELVKLW